MQFGQLVIGPPGSGKTTYCSKMLEFLSKLGRKVAVINIDPANDCLPFKPDVDISELVTVTDVMENMHLGPNGGLVYCMEFLEKNLEWLLKELYKLSEHYLLIDCPGQVELYTHHKSVHNIVAQLQKADIRLTAVHLIDSHYCTDPAKFISVLLTSLSTMLQVELPYVNILSKVDLVEQHGKLHFHLDYYTEVLNLSYLLEQLSDDPFLSKFKKLNEAFVGLIEDYSLVSFLPLNIQNKKNMMYVLQAVDKANGYIFGMSEQEDVRNVLASSSGMDYEKVGLGTSDDQDM